MNKASDLSAHSIRYSKVSLFIVGIAVSHLLIGALGFHTMTLSCARCFVGACIFIFWTVLGIIVYGE